MRNNRLERGGTYFKELLGYQLFLPKSMIDLGSVLHICMYRNLNEIFRYTGGKKSMTEKIGGFCLIGRHVLGSRTSIGSVVTSQWAFSFVKNR